MLKQKLFIRFDCFLDDPEAPEPEFEVVSADITEALSTPYEIKLKLSSSLLNLIPRTFIKQPGRLILHFGHHKRYFHGIIGVFKQLQMVTTPDGDTVCFYEACLYPQFWFLQFNKDYRIFQEKSTLDIVTTLLEENELLHVTFPKLHKTSVLEHADPVRKYCVQYGESDFDFISRLLEDRGFYYYFDHHSTKHYLKLAFTRHDHKKCPVVDTIEIRDTDFKGNELNKILTYEITSRMLPQHQVRMDYNYEHASLEMISHVHSVGDGGVIYEYPGGFSHMHDGHVKTKHFVEDDETQTLILSGKSVAPFFSPGFKFTLSGHPNVLFDEKVFTLETVTHHIIDPRFAGEDDILYTNTFTAFLSIAPYRPALKTPKPKIHGTQTAIVVAPHGEEVWTDEHGRVKVQFHWNHRGYRKPVVIHAAEHNEMIHHHKSHHKKKHHHHIDEEDSVRHHHKRHKHHKHHHVPAREEEPVYDDTMLVAEEE
jgi:type VI secretion system secreted protein VgrG